MLAVALALSVAALFAGPLVATWVNRRGIGTSWLDGVVLGVVPALILLRLLPHLVEEIGTRAAVALGVGFLGYFVVERTSHTHPWRFGDAVVLPSLAIHAFLDGTALAIALRSGTTGVVAVAVGAALVVHKLPEGLFLASIYLPTAGLRGALLRIAFLGAATVVGGLSGRELLEHAPNDTLHIVVAVGLGVMLRMTTHRHAVTPATPRERAATGIAFVASLAAVVALPSPHDVLRLSQPGELSALSALIPFVLETSPYLLCVLAIARLVRSKAPSLPDGLPLTFALPAIAVSLPLGGTAVAVTVGVSETALLLARARAIGASSQATFRAFLAPDPSRTLATFAIGVVACSAAEAAIPNEGLRELGLPLATVVVLAVAARLRGPTIALVGTLLLHKGAPLGVVLAMLVASSLLTVARQESRATTLTVVALSIGASVGALTAFDRGAPTLHDLGQHAHRAVEWAAAAALSVWAVADLVRQGPRRWLSTSAERDP